MQINLAGYNVDTEILERLNAGKNEILTPETFSAAYARISRSSRDVSALRKEAREDVTRARKSNETIIFGMGHHSVAEHAVFNLDLIGVSRLALEEIEKCRLVSYTEKSQRYVTLAGDCLIPEEIADKESRQIFEETIRIQNAFYKKSFSVLRDYIFDEFSQLAENKENHSLLEGWAKEDARYILSLATLGQVGMTINARNLEHLFRRLALSRRRELKQIGDKIFSLVKNVAPSLILFPEPSAFERELAISLPRYVGVDLPPRTGPVDTEPEIIEGSEKGDDTVLAALFSIHNHIPYRRAAGIVENMKPGEKGDLFLKLFKKMEFFDIPPREFELPDITFQAVVSASNFAQLKRHRMATLVSGAYNIDFGNTVPESIRRNGLAEEFLGIVKRTNDAYLKLKSRYERAADYILTNSHRRRVIMKMNMREVYHFMRLRDDEHAQWDIRHLAGALLKKIKKIMPLSGLLLCGKSDFIETYENIYGGKPDYPI